MEAYGSSPRQGKKPRKDCKVKRLRAAYKLVDRKEKSLSLSKIKHFLASDMWFLADQEELEQSVNDSHSLLELSISVSLSLDLTSSSTCAL